MRWDFPLNVGREVGAENLKYLKIRTHAKHRWVYMDSREG